MTNNHPPTQPPAGEYGRSSKRRRFAVLARMGETAGEVLRVEGERGIANRWTVLLRYLSYLGGIYITSLIVGAYPALGPLATRLLQVSCAVIICAACAASIAYPTERRALVDQMRFWVFGVVCFPALVLGALMSVVTASIAGASSHALSAAGDRVMVNLAATALPYAFWLTVVVPPFIFVKTVVGLRKIHRDRTDDEEMMSRLARQDQFFR